MAMNALPRLSIAVALVSSLSACSTVGPDYSLPQHAVFNLKSVSAAFGGSKEKTVISAPLPNKWWRLYEDPTLDAMVEQALTANTDLRIAAANLARTRAALDEARTSQIPAVSASVSPTYGRASAAAKGLSNPLPDGWAHDGGVSVSYLLDFFGKISRGIEAASADADAAQAAYDLTRVSVAAETAKAYSEICSANRQIQSARHSVDLQQQQLSSTERLHQLGRGTAVDISRAKSQLEKIRAALPPLEAQQKSALYRLATLTGKPPVAMDEKIGQCAKIPQLARPIPVGDGAALLKRRPDIRQAERSLAAATARIGVATADLYPSINLGLSVGSTGPMSTLGKANAFRWALGPLISWSLPDTSAARSRIAQAEASNQAALARFDATVLTALRETENALTMYARELDHNAHLKAARDQSRVASEQTQRLYRSGRADFLAALDAQRTLASDESALAASDAQLINDQIALFLALGGGWEQGVPTPDK